MKVKVISAIIGGLLGVMAGIYGSNNHEDANIPQYSVITESRDVFVSEIPATTTVVKTETVESKEPSYVLLDSIPMSGDLQIYAQEKCKQYNIPYSMFLAFCESESSFRDLGAVEDGGADSYGRMQIRECNWNRYDGLDVRDPYDNLEIGIRMISELKEKYMEADEIIMAYKGGESAMLKWVSEGTRLDICDKVEERMIFWEGELNAVRQ